MMDLIYGPASVQEIIKKQYPDAMFEDASDMVYEERFEFRTQMEDTLSDNYIEFILREGLAQMSLHVGLEIQMHPERVMRVLTKMKTEKMAKMDMGKKL